MTKSVLPGFGVELRPLVGTFMHNKSCKFVTFVRSLRNLPRYEQATGYACPLP